MSNPISSIGQAITNTVDDFVTNLRAVPEQVAAAAEDVAGAVKDVAKQVGAVADNVAQAVGDVGGAVKDAAADVASAVQEEGIGNVAANVTRHNMEEGARIVAAMEGRSPGEFVDWMLGPEGPSVADQTALIPGLQQGIGDVLDRSMENPMVAGAVGKAFGFEYVPGADFYTTNEYSAQSYFGFHDIYDKAAKPLGMDLEEKIFEFQTKDGTEYRMQIWKGAYGSGGAFGGEIGLYTRGTGERGAMGDALEQIPGYYSTAGADSQVQTSQTIYNKHTGEEYFTNDDRGARDGDHYWNLAIRTDPGISHDDIGQRGSLVMNSPETAEALYTEMREQGMDVQLDGSTVSYDWK